MNRRVLLINPPSPEGMGSPLLGQQYVAASLLQDGCEVRVIDAAGRHFHHDTNWIVEQCLDFQPTVIGFGLFSRWVFHAYQLAEVLSQAGTWTMVAGGAHTTVRPRETLDHGFDIAVTGEAEESFSELVQALAAGVDPEAIPGVVTPAGNGCNPAQRIQDLDALASPATAHALYDPAWYNKRGLVKAPGGLITSRGCPARCTFCANYVTGRKFRHRSAANVVAEIQDWHALSNMSFFPFWDDALTANPHALSKLCDAFEGAFDFPFTFGAITRANMVTPKLLKRMREVGLRHVNFGVESGDDAILKIIKKGIKTDHVVRALEWAKAEGLSTACNFMLGFPEDTPSTLERTLAFMKRIAPLTDTFSTLGVAVPFPGTPLYEDHHEHYGFTDWWLREDHSHYEPFPDPNDTETFCRHYIDDKNLELNFFNYESDTQAMMRECLKFKGEHNLKKMGLLKDPVFSPEPTASLDAPPLREAHSQPTALAGERSS